MPDTAASQTPITGPTTDDLLAFIDAYPDILPADIPQHVWDESPKEGGLVSAFRKYENEVLRSEIASLRQEAENRQTALGSASSDGEQIGDPIVSALLG